MEKTAFVTVGVYSSLLEASLAKGRLEAEGILCHLANENIVRMNPFYTNAVGGLQLQVDAERLEDARNLLNTPLPESEQAVVQTTRCPACASERVVRGKRNWIWFLLSWAFFAPIALDSRKSVCRECGHVWK